MWYTLYMPSICQVNFLYMHDIYFVYTMYIKEFWTEFPETLKYSWQVKDAEHRLRHKLFLPNAWMKLTDFGSWDYMGSTSFPPLCTATPRCCNVQISFGMIGTGLLIQLCPMSRWPEYSGALPTDFRVLWPTLPWWWFRPSMLHTSWRFTSYVKKTENAKFTGDRVRFLMLTLPFLVRARDLIAPEVTWYSLYIACIYIDLQFYMVYTRYMSWTRRSAPRPETELPPCSMCRRSRTQATRSQWYLSELWNGICWAGSGMWR